MSTNIQRPFLYFLGSPDLALEWRRAKAEN